MKKRKKIFVFVICLSVVAVLTIALGIFINSIKLKTYSTAKIECEKVLSKYQTEMEEISNGLLKSITSVEILMNGFIFAIRKKIL